jgi:hypothetical protein
VRADQLLEVAVGGLDVLVDALELADQLDGEPAAGLPNQVTRTHRDDQRAGLRGGQGTALRHRESAPAAAGAAG